MNRATGTVPRRVLFEVLGMIRRTDTSVVPNSTNSIRRLASRSVTLPNWIFGACMGVVLWALAVQAGELDNSLRLELQQQGITQLSPTPAGTPAKFELGRMLFFDKHLSGNQDTACASCHHPSLASGDARSLPSGTGGVGLGPDRTTAEGHDPIPRNSPEIFARGQAEFQSMFWDSRVEIQDGQLKTPAGPALPQDVNGVLTAQAMFPVTSRAEMRGFVGDTTSSGNRNELADIDDSDLPAIWQALMDRLQAIPEYNRLFEEAYPDIPAEQLGFQQAADAIATFEADAFASLDSAWDRYVAGDIESITESAKRGAHLFYGSANCASCHSGKLLTDQQHHDLCVPQLGPGKDPNTGLDPGRVLVTGNKADEFAFRTPPLRNVAATGPWMHNGAYTNLEDAVRHHLDPAAALANYDLQQLDPELQSMVRMDPDVIAALVAEIDPLLDVGLGLSDQDVNDLTAFLFSLTSPSLDLLPSLVPDAVPSGLSVDAMPVGSVHVLYNKDTGELSLEGPGDAELSSVMLRVRDTLDELPAELAFLKDAAAWSDDTEIVLANDERTQSFLEYRKDAPFRLRAGDSLGLLLPAGLAENWLKDYVTAAYMFRGSLAMWTADVAYVPEPASVIPCFVSLVLLFARSGRKRATEAGLAAALELIVPSDDPERLGHAVHRRLCDAFDRRSIISPLRQLKCPANGIRTRVAVSGAIMSNQQSQRGGRHWYLHISDRPSSGLRPPSPGGRRGSHRTSPSPAPAGEGDHTAPPLLPAGEGGRRPDEGRLITARSCIRRTSSCVDTNGGGGGRKIAMLSRRAFLRAGVVGAMGLSLADLLRLDAMGAVRPEARSHSVILLWMRGGPSQHETWDPKPNAPVEFRGAFGAMPTAVPGIQICDLLPMSARIMSKWSIVRSLHHTDAGHSSADYLLFTGYPGQANAAPDGPGNFYPSCGSIVAKQGSPQGRQLPPYVMIPRMVPGTGPGYLGPAYQAFETIADPASEGAFRVPDLSLAAGLEANRLGGRRELLASLDRVRREVAWNAEVHAVDEYQQRAWDLLVRPTAAAAFDLDAEPSAVRERYGFMPAYRAPTPDRCGVPAWSQRFLLAHRLVEHGVRLVTVDCRWWDTHVKGYETMRDGFLPRWDQAFSALIEDLEQRGLLESTLVLAWGEFGRTPRVNNTGGRDHYPNVFSAALAGGPVQGGRVVGSSDSKGAFPTDNPKSVQDVLATMYRHLGIDTTTTYQDNSGRPHPILPSGKPIRELA